MRAQLIPFEGGPPVEVDRDLTVIGRQEDCDVRIDHKTVSKLHCVIVKTDGLLLLRDLGSTNGTRVNGQRVRRAALLPNDLLAIAGYRYRVYFGPDNAPVPVHEYTQQMEAADVVDLVRRKHRDDETAGGTSAAPIQPNQLPDVYPDGPSAE